MLSGELKVVLHLDSMFITVSEVRISADLKIATAFVSSINKDHIDAIVKYLNENASIVRKALSPKLHLKYTPQIRFMYDKSFDEGARMEKVFNTIKE